MPVPEGRALVYVFNAGGPLTGASFTLFANAERIGDLATDTYYVLDCEPGLIRLDVPFGNGSALLSVSAISGQRHFVQMVLRRTVIPALVVLVSRDMLKLEPVEETEGVAKLGRLAGLVRVTPHREEEDQARAREAPPGSALVFVFRSQWSFPDVDFAVSVDHHLVTKLAARSFFAVEVPPGTHGLNVKGDNYAEGDLPLSVEAGRAYYIVLLPRPGFFTNQVDVRDIGVRQGRALLEELRLATPIPRQ